MKPSEKITKIIIDTPVEIRGNLLADIAKQLKLESQGYTSGLFSRMAMEYGINPNPTKFVNNKTPLT